jgi:hypothetical protein
VRCERGTRLAFIAGVPGYVRPDIDSQEVEVGLDDMLKQQIRERAPELKRKLVRSSRS